MSDPTPLFVPRPVVSYGIHLGMPTVSWAAAVDFSMQALDFLAQHPGLLGPHGAEVAALLKAARGLISASAASTTAVEN